MRVLLLKAKLLFLALALLSCAMARADCPPGDLNEDCQVDVADLALFAGQWLTTAKTAADLNRDGRVDEVDWAILANHWRERDCPIVINEVLAHAHAAASDWIELYNTSNIPVHVGGWFLSDDKDDLEPYEIAAGTIIEPHGYFVLYEKTSFGSRLDPGMHRVFAFSENGDAAYLYTGADPVFPGCLIEQPFGASDTGWPFGRYLTSLGQYHFVIMSTPTPGAANAYPRVGPVVINEIMYHPAGSSDAEYVELLNIGSAPVTLYDPAQMEPWRLTDDMNVDLRLPVDPPVTLQPNECLLLIRDPRAMKQYPVPTGVQTLNWGAGKLDNAGGLLRLLKPGDVDRSGLRYWIEVDRLDYSDGSHGPRFPRGIDPWPGDADGYGLSLSRLLPTRYGNDPNNWQARFPTPGASNN